MNTLNNLPKYTDNVIYLDFHYNRFSGDPTVREFASAEIRQHFDTKKICDAEYIDYHKDTHTFYIVDDSDEIKLDKEFFDENARTWSAEELQYYTDVYNAVLHKVFDESIGFEYKIDFESKTVTVRKGCIC